MIGRNPKLSNGVYALVAQPRELMRRRFLGGSCRHATGCQSGIIGSVISFGFVSTFCVLKEHLSA